MKSILDGVTLGSTGGVDVHNPMVAETDKEIHKEVQEAVVQARATHMCVNLHVTDWTVTHWEDPVLKAVINWISNQKVQNLKHLLGDDVNTEEEVAVLQEQKKLMLYQGALYHFYTLAGKLEEILQFVVSMTYQVTAMNGCC